MNQHLLTELALADKDIEAIRGSIGKVSSDLTDLALTRLQTRLRDLALGEITDSANDFLAGQSRKETSEETIESLRQTPSGKYPGLQQMYQAMKEEEERLQGQGTFAVNTTEGFPEDSTGKLQQTLDAIEDHHLFEKPAPEMDTRNTYYVPRERLKAWMLADPAIADLRESDPAPFDEAELERMKVELSPHNMFKKTEPEVVPPSAEAVKYYLDMADAADFQPDWVNTAQAPLPEKFMQAHADALNATSAHVCADPQFPCPGHPPLTPARKIIDHID